MLPTVSSVLVILLTLVGIAFIGFCIHVRIVHPAWKLCWFGLFCLFAGLSSLTTFYRFATSLAPSMTREHLVGLFGARIVVGGLALAGAALIFLAIIRWRVTMGLLDRLALALCPAVLFLTASVLANSIGSSPPAIADSGQTSTRPGATKAVVLIFDELDYQYLFTQRPPWIRLDEFDRFSRNCDNYRQCWPSAGNTYRSVPSMITGRPWAGAKPGRGLEEMLKDPSTGRWQVWSQVDDLFVSLGQLGWRSNMIQWRHVFPETFLVRRPGLVVHHQSDFPCWQEVQHAYRSPLGTWVRIWQNIREGIFGLGRFFHPGDIQFARQARIRSLESMRYELRNAIESGRYDLIWAHLPCPHVPAVWDSRKQSYVETPKPGLSNLDNMALADRILGEVRSSLEQKGAWNDALVIVTSDHWQREGAGENLPPNPQRLSTIQGYRVPFLVKKPRQGQGRSIDLPVTNTYLRVLVEQMARDGKIEASSPLPAPAENLLQMLNVNESH